MVSNSQRTALQLEHGTNSGAKWEVMSVPGGEDPMPGTFDKAASDTALLSLALSSFEQKHLGGLSIRSKLILLGAAAIAILKLVPSHSLLWSSSQTNELSEVGSCTSCLFMHIVNHMHTLIKDLW